ncbi:MAG: antibiotic biosynthesis monooxygenase [Desulfobacterales bacterium]|uniref:Antibiotic biosynthesis monooxygenase n=1 Tax=Candidatus Desulfatibia vada TaxID=2841696 RepID=A0A8J6NQ91_9BACT|nr:antibiotic biosynthesis monooxygenase [Candidatus Desulfatibia vada]MBL6972671.1 antibiotic biosynthesis monooxygenase [Desulfobacterales bacterium]
MTVKIIIKRLVPESKEATLRPLLKKLRNLAMDQPGYVTGETFKRIDRPGESLVISTWQSMDDWRKWLLSEERSETQEKIDYLLGEKTEYEIYSFD